jgi:hypothetical protein
MPALVAGIHVFLTAPLLHLSRAWMAGTIGEGSDAVFDGYARP